MDEEYDEQESFTDLEDQIEDLTNENKKLKRQLKTAEVHIRNYQVALKDALERNKSEQENARVFETLYEHKKEEVETKKDLISRLQRQLKEEKTQTQRLLSICRANAPSLISPSPPPPPRRNLSSVPTVPFEYHTDDNVEPYVPMAQTPQKKSSPKKPINLDD